MEELKTMKKPTSEKDLKDWQALRNKRPPIIKSMNYFVMKKTLLYEKQRYKNEVKKKLSHQKSYFPLSKKE